MIMPEQNHWNLYVMQMFPPVLGFLKAYCILYPNVYLTIVFNNIDIFLFLKTVLKQSNTPEMDLVNKNFLSKP